MAVFPTPHVARPLRYEEDDGAQWVEGEPGDGPEPTPGEPFGCFLFLPLGSEEAAQPRSRKVSRPTVMWDPAEVVGGQPGPDEELLIFAPELASWAGEATARWQIEGEPQPFGPPGSVIGVQANLKQVRG